MHSCCMLTACKIPPIISITRNEEGSKNLSYPTWGGGHYQNLGCSFYGSCQQSLISPHFAALQGATLFSKDLERNGVSTEECIYEITYYGKGRMPGFGEKCTPRGQCTFGARLQAEQGWPNIEIYKD